MSFRRPLNFGQKNISIASETQAQTIAWNTEFTFKLEQKNQSLEIYSLLHLPQYPDSHLDDKTRAHC